MPRSFFTRVLTQNFAVLALALLVGGYLLDDFLTTYELRRLGDQVGRFALLVREQLPPAGPEGERQQLLSRLEASTRVRFTVIDKNGAVLADSLLDPAKMENHASHPEVAEALAGREGRNLRKSQSLGIDMLYVALPGDPVVRAAVPVSEVQSVLTSVHLSMALAAAPALLLALALAWLLSRELTWRVGRMRHFSLALERGDFAASLRAEGDDELSDMERSLLALRDEIREKVERLKSDAEVLSGLVESFPHAVLLFDGRLNLALANSRARGLLRIGAAEGRAVFAGEAIRQPRILGALEAASRGEPVEPFRLAWSEPPGQFEVTVSTLLGTDPGRGFILILRDVTKETHLEKVRSDFMVNLSHELRTPLTAIRGSAETLLSTGLEEREVVRRFLETIRRNSLRLEALLRDAADLARAEHEIEPAKAARFDARTTLLNAVELFRGEAAKAGVEVRTVTPEAPLELFSVEEKVEQVLINLLQNAVRYTHEGGRVTASVGVEGGAVAFRVADTGIGIPESDLSRVTERFYRVDPGRSREVGGTGLGLSIVKHLAESLGAKLEIESELGRGTTVTVTMPPEGKTPG